MMSTIITLVEADNAEPDNPGTHLASARQQRGLSIEFVASKLHLRIRIIELLENGDFHLLPEPVFIKGYLRAYAKLLGISPEPLLTVFNNQYAEEKKSDRALLWQSKRESHKAEHVIRWVTILFALGVMVAVGIWWQKNRDIHQGFSAKENTSVTELSLNKGEEDIISSTDITKMQSLLLPQTDMSPLEKEGA